MHILAVLTSLVILIGSAHVLTSTRALAQTTTKLDTSRPARAKLAVAKQQTPPAASPDANGDGGETLAPVVPSPYSVTLLGDHLLSLRWELAAVGAAMATVGFKDWDWGEGSKFRFIREGWFGQNTRHGGMDKIGHAFSTYVIGDILTDRIRANAANPAGAQITGGLVAFGIMTLAETLDGFTGKHRFSREDIAANAAGAAFSILRNSIPGMRDKLDWRVMYTPRSFERPGVSSWEDGILPPYERQRFIMALKASGFDALKATPLRYVEFQTGFDARGFEKRERELRHPVERTCYVGVGLNLNELLFGQGPLPNFASHRDSLPAQVIQKTFEYVQVPYTAAHHGTRSSTIRATR